MTIAPVRVSAMAPRLQHFHGLRALPLCLRPSSQKPSFLPLVQSASMSRKEAKERQRLDPYGWAQALQRKMANQQRKKELREERASRWGDPVAGLGGPTPFVESFDFAGQAPLSEPERDADGNAIGHQHALPTSPHMLNYFLNTQELEEHLAYAKGLNKPYRITGDFLDAESSTGLNQKRTRQWEMDHTRASDAIRRIMTLENAGGKMRRHANIRRCVEEFGRHNSDGVFWPKVKKHLAHGPTGVLQWDLYGTKGALLSPVDSGPSGSPEDGEEGAGRGDDPEEFYRRRRSGPDTGSSEVQISILTMKIRKLSNALGTDSGRKDIANKRNLRLLVHRRQKLMKYMWNKEKNSPRWQHMMEKLGLSPATWQGEIVV